MGFRRLLLTFSLLLSAFISYAQVTSSSITGTVRSEKGEPLSGASLIITHKPTGTVYRLTSGKSGTFNLNNIPAGGPYEVSATYVGYQEQLATNINVPLGEKYDVPLVLYSASTNLKDIVVTGTRAREAKTGASTNISNRQVQNVPNIGRSVLSLSKLTPQTGKDNAFLGMNSRFNNITIDGSVFNNNFGRSGDGIFPGGNKSSSISVDAIDQVQVNLAPYDVRQAGFTGAGINAVTRRGTNEWYGTVYDYYNNESFNGSRVNGRKLEVADKSSNIFGGSIGGPIIKDKLFFFVNAEHEKRDFPGQVWRAARSADEAKGNTPNVAPVLASDLNALRDFVQKQYGYNVGDYEGYGGYLKNTKFVGRVDWNISDKHRLTLRYNQSKTLESDRVNSNSGPNPRFTNSRRGGKTDGLNFTSSNFDNESKLISGVAELNSTFSNKVSNQFLASYTKQSYTRVPPNSIFPFVDIMNGNGVYTSFGTDLYSFMNIIDEKVFNVADNVTYNLGKHVLTGGASFDYMKFANTFGDFGSASYYRYASLQDFYDNKAPTVFAVTYSNTDRNSIAPAKANFAQLGVYLQDAWSVNDKFKLTYGLRADLPFYPGSARDNRAFTDTIFRDADGNPERLDLSKWPKARILLSPRVGFNYDVLGDKSLVIRGGTGIFTGRIPFIWLVNQVSDNGMLNSKMTLSGAAASEIRFSTDRNKYVPATLPTPGTTLPAPTGNIFSAAASDFKMPQVWRSNLAVDKTIAEGLVATVEGVYSRIINNVYFRNANLGDVKGNLAGPDNRPLYNRSYNRAFNEVSVMDNLNKGYNLSLTAQLRKTFAKGFEGSVSYTFTKAEDAVFGDGDRSSSSWSTNSIVNNANHPEMGNSIYAVPHRVMAYASYKLNYWKQNAATTFSLFYSGSHQSWYFFRYGGDLNGDGATNDLFYVPRNPGELTFLEGYKNRDGEVFTAQQQSDAFFKLIEGNKYLREHKGQYVKRNGALLPWVNSLDLRVLQDFYLKTGNKRHTLQISADIVNVLNLLNNKWGNRYFYNYGNFQDQGILGLNKVDAATNKPVFTYDPTQPSKVYDYSYSTSDTWTIQLGLRYIFN